MPSSVGAVVVNYNAGDHLVHCVESLRREDVSELVVVDNGSTDGSVAALRDRYPEVEVDQMGRNLGYGAAVNRGAKATRADALLVCNPDVRVEPGAVRAMVAALASDEGIGVVGPKLLEPDGALYPSARRFPSLADSAGHAFVGLLQPDNPFSRRYKMLAWDHSSRQAVDWVSGACFLVRNAAFESVDGFDESYFMYMEDVDLCWRLAEIGWEVVYEPAARVVHTQGASTDLHPYRMILAHHRSMLRFAGRTSTGWRIALVPLMAAAMTLRAGLACGKRKLEERDTGRAGTSPGASE